jgi:ABC-type multidrug transport system fused ATPase/permease subunit
MSERRGVRDGGVLHLYKELWELTRGYRHMLVAAMLLLIGAQCVLLTVPYAAGHAINALQTEGAQGMRAAGGWLALVVVITAASWILHGPGRLLERNVALAVRRRISGGLVDRLLQLPLSWHEANHSGATAHRVQQSSHALSGFAQSQFIYLNSAVRLVGPVLALWWLEPIVGIAAVVGFCVICLSVIGFDRAMIRLAHLENDAERRYSSTLIDSLSNSATLFALRQARAVSSLLQRRLEAIFAPLKRAIFLNEAKWCTVDIASRALSCGLVALFAWLAASHQLVSGKQVLMLGSIYMVWEYASQAGGVISAVASHFQTFARQHADYASADAIRDAQPMAYSSDSPAAQGAWERCEIRDVTFRHAAARSETPTLDHVTFSLERGKRYALIGGSGSGKSTLLRVIAGLYEAERVVVDQNGGPAIMSASEAARFFRATTTLIPQDAEVFEGSLAENLGLCDSLAGNAVTSADFLRALSIACVGDFIELSEAGLAVPIAERAANWSGGQRARVALARGVLAAKSSALILLDEPTASLDPKTESVVYDNLFTAFSDACVISSVHRLNLLDRFDEVLVMHNGRLVAQGPASVLAATSPDFRQLIAVHRRHADSERVA